MELRFILGRAGTGKTRLCLTEITELLSREGEAGPPLILLVPEQASFQMERALLGRFRRAATARGQVLSFHRLAHRVIQTTGGGSGRVLGELGRQMVLRRILLHHADDLQLFAASARQPGFVTGLARTVAELRAHRVGAAELAEQRQRLLAAGDPHPLLGQKLHDLGLIMNEYEDYLGAQYRDPDDLLRLTAANLPAVQDLRGAQIWVDGFSGFTPQEYEVLAALLPVARRVNVALCVDGRLPLAATPEPAGLFFTTHETYQKLTALGRRQGVELAPDVVLDGAVSPRFRRAPALAHLENNLYRLQMPPYEGQLSPTTVQVTACTDPRHEVECAARHIVSLCRDHRYRFRDISVMVRDLATYDDLISQTFRAYGIPCFIDRRRPLTHHPLLELVRAALAVVTRGWSYEAMFRYLKTDLAPLPRTAVDSLENYVLEHGLQGSVWTRAEPWRYARRYSLDEEAEPQTAGPAGGGQSGAEQDGAARGGTTIDDYRRRAAAPLIGLQKALVRQPLTTRQGCSALYNFLIALQVPEALTAWSEQARAAGDLTAAGEHRQAWERLVGLLDELVDALGDETMTPRAFADVLGAGAEGLSLALIPPGLDQVLVGSIDRSRQPDVRAALLLGVNEGHFPRTTGEDLFFDDAERGELAAGGLELAPDSRRLLFRERYLAYIAVTRPRDSLWVSYPTADAASRSLAPSELTLWIGRLLPGLVVTRPRPSTGTGSGPDAGTGAGIVADRWQADSLTGARPPGALAPALVSALYGPVLRTSVSRLQSFAACPFQHFAAHGLGLMERRRHQVEAPELGTLYHAILRAFVLRLKTENLDWASLDPDKAMVLAAAVTDELLPRLQNEILLSTARYRHLAQQVRRTMAWAVTVLGEHARRSDFAPAALELTFGLAGPDQGGEGLPAYRIPLGDGQQLELRGQIDRIDTTPGWLRVIDYKRTGRALSLQDVYFGLNIQLPAYLLVAAAAAPQDSGLRPAGAFFFGILEPVLRLDGPVTAREATAQRLKEARLKGVVVRDPDLLRLMDKDIVGHSDLITARLNKDGSVGKNPLVVPAADLQDLLTWTERRLAATGRTILTGAARVAPYRRPDGKSPCEWCDFAALCQFEPGLHGHYRNLPSLAPPVVWDRIRAEVAKTAPRGPAAPADQASGPPRPGQTPPVPEVET